MFTTHRLLLRHSVCAVLMLVPAVLTSCVQNRTPESVYATIERQPDEPTIRIRVARNVSESMIGGPNRVLVTPLAQRGSRQRVSAASSGRSDVQDRVLSTPVLVKRSGGFVRATDASGKRVQGDAGLQIVAVGTGLLTIDGTDAPGTVWYHAVEGGGLDAVEHVAMEAYLPGVLEKELPGGWGEAAYEAQAIAARSFALHERTRKMRLGAHFDVESTTVSQVYGGAVIERWSHNAVRATSGKVLKHNEELVRAYFSSTSGGRSSSAMDIWGAGGDGRLAFNASPALQVSTGAVQRRTRPDGSGWDSASPRYRWTAERLVGPLSDRIRAYGAKHGFSIARMTRVVSIDASTRNASGRPIQFTLSDDSGKDWRMPAEHLRWAMGAGDNIAGGSVWSSDFEVHIEGNTAFIEGRGWGHGVGLCQWSAQGMASAGWTAPEILDVFYPGSEIDKAW